jgi:hypothetical protein
MEIPSKLLPDSIYHFAAIKLKCSVELTERGKEKIPRVILPTYLPPESSQPILLRTKFKFIASRCRRIQPATSPRGPNSSTVVSNRRRHSLHLSMATIFRRLSVSRCIPNCYVFLGFNQFGIEQSHGILFLAITTASVVSTVSTVNS